VGRKRNRSAFQSDGIFGIEDIRVCSVSDMNLDFTSLLIFKLDGDQMRTWAERQLHPVAAICVVPDFSSTTILQPHSNGEIHTSP